MYLFELSRCIVALLPEQLAAASQFQHEIWPGPGHPCHQHLHSGTIVGVDCSAAAELRELLKQIEIAVTLSAMGFCSGHGSLACE